MIFAGEYDVLITFEVHDDFDNKCVTSQVHFVHYTSTDLTRFDFVEEIIEKGKQQLAQKLEEQDPEFSASLSRIEQNGVKNAVVIFMAFDHNHRYTDSDPEFEG